MTSPACVFDEYYLIYSNVGCSWLSDGGGGEWLEGGGLGLLVHAVRSGLPTSCLLMAWVGTYSTSNRLLFGFYLTLSKVDESNIQQCFVVPLSTPSLNGDTRDMTQAMHAHVNCLLVTHLTMRATNISSEVKKWTGI